MHKPSSSTDAIARRARLSTREIAIAIALTIAALIGALLTLGSATSEDPPQASAAKVPQSKAQ